MLGCFNLKRVLGAIGVQTVKLPLRNTTPGAPKLHDFNLKRVLGAIGVQTVKLPLRNTTPGAPKLHDPQTPSRLSPQAL